MRPSGKTLIDLEARFWQSMVDQATDAAVSRLDEPALQDGRACAGCEVEPAVRCPPN